MFLGYAHLSANGTTIVKDRPGILSSVTINTAGAGSNTLQIEDADGAVIANIDTTAAVGTRIYEIQFERLIAVMATGTAADVTIAYE